MEGTRPSKQKSKEVTMAREAHMAERNKGGACTGAWEEQGRSGAMANTEQRQGNNIA